jgi:hypothetical protein
VGPAPQGRCAEVEACDPSSAKYMAPLLEELSTKRLRPMRWTPWMCRNRVTPSMSCPPSASTERNPRGLLLLAMRANEPTTSGTTPFESATDVTPAAVRVMRPFMNACTWGTGLAGVSWVG